MDASINNNFAQFDLRVCAELMSLSARYGRWDLAYVYANETLALMLEANDDGSTSLSSFPHIRVAATAAEIEQARRCALYMLMPAKRWMDRVERLVARARTCAANGNHEEVVRLCSLAYFLQQAKTHAPLMLRAEAYRNLERADLCYVDMNEASLLMKRITADVSNKKKEARNKLPSYRSRTPFNERKRNRVLQEYCMQMNNARFASGYLREAWPSRGLQISSLLLSWADFPTPICVMCMEDGSLLTPHVRFYDLPLFFEHHPECSPSSIHMVGSGGTPTESHMRPLLALGALRGGDGLGVMESVRMDRLDFHNITAATFEQLFSQLLRGQNYFFADLKRLPIGIHSANFLLNPALLARGEKLEIAQLMDPHMTRPVGAAVKFGTASVIAHLKATSAPATTYKPLEEKDGIVAGIVPSRTLRIGETCLLDGMLALVKAIKHDFFTVAGATAEQKQAGGKKSAVFPFRLYITYRDASAFNSLSHHAGEWSNAAGERLSISAKEDTARDIPAYDPYFVEILRE